MKMYIFLILSIVLFGCIIPESNSDKETSVNQINSNDAKCRSIGDGVVESLNVYYPSGFSCDSTLLNSTDDSVYFSKTKCSCLRGYYPYEVIIFDRNTKEVSYISDNVKYN